MANDYENIPMFDPVAVAEAATNISAKQEEIKSQRLRNRITQMQLDQDAQNKAAQATFYANPTAKMPSFAGGLQPGQAVSPILTPPPQAAPDNGLNSALIPPNLGQQGASGPNSLAGDLPAKQSINGPVGANEGAGGTSEASGDIKDKIDKAQSVALGSKKLNSMGNMFMQAIKNKDSKTAEQLGKFAEKDENIQDLFQQANFNMTVEKDKDSGDPLMGMTADWPKKSLMEMSQWKGGASLANLPDGARVKMVFDPVKHEVTKIEAAPTEKGSEGILTDKQMSSDNELIYASKYGKTQEIRDAANSILKSKEQTKLREVRESKDVKDQGKIHFNDMTQAQKERLIQEQNLTGTQTKFAFGDQQSYTQLDQAQAQYNLDHGLTPGKLARLRAEYKGISSAISKTEVNRVNTQIFVDNLNAQVDRVNELQKYVTRTNMRLLNIPIKELKTMVFGNADEVNLQSYLIEISNESGKLSGGAQSSVRELSPYQAEKWNKVHDGLLPGKELIKVLRETKKLANTRLQMYDKALDDYGNRLDNLSEGNRSGKTTGAGKEKAQAFLQPGKPTYTKLPLASENSRVHIGVKMTDDKGIKWVYTGKNLQINNGWEKQ